MEPVANGFPHEHMPTLSSSSDDVRVYEIAVMIQPDLDQKSSATLLKDIDQLFAEAKATLLFKDAWSKRGLAYPIKGFTEAKFIIYYYEMPPAAIRELDRQLRLLRGVLRHMVVIPPKGYEAVSYEDLYQQWLKTRETVEEQRRRKKADEMQERVTVSAKRAVRRKETSKRDEKSSSKPVEMAKLSAELDKLISDEDLKI